MVGIFTDFDSDAMWAAISVPNRDLYRYMGVKGRIGAARALCRANIPWEHVTGDNLRRGLADRYRIIMLPSVISLSEDLLELLQAYVQRGGRLAVDLPGLWLDAYGRLRSSGKGSRFENLFGCTLDDYQFSANKPRRLRDQHLSGFVCDCTLTDGEARDLYENGAPAVIEKQHGAGSAILLGYEAAQRCYEHAAGAQRRLVEDVVGSRQPAYACDGAFVWKLATPDADHFFLINDAEAKSVHLHCFDKRYCAMSDAITGESVNPESILIDRASGRWIRALPGG
jgi:beta-galactosidase